MALALAWPFLFMNFFFKGVPKAVVEAMILRWIEKRSIHILMPPSITDMGLGVVYRQAPFHRPQFSLLLAFGPPWFSLFLFTFSFSPSTVSIALIGGMSPVESGKNTKKKTMRLVAFLTVNGAPKCDLQIETCEGHLKVERFRS